VVVGVPVKDVCGCEVWKLRSGGADMEDEADDSDEEAEEVEEVVVCLPPLGCFFGDAATNGSDPIRASTSIPL
jgi:hypothetical protein